MQEHLSYDSCMTFPIAKLTTLAHIETDCLYARVALATPLHGLFDYRIPHSVLNQCDQQHLIGARVEVPFRTRTMIGFILEVTTQAHYEPKKIRPIKRLIDTSPAIDEFVIRMARWCSQYFFYPIGESLATLLPSQLKQGKPYCHHQNQIWHATALGQLTEKKLSPSQQKALQLLRDHGELSVNMLLGLEVQQRTLDALHRQQLADFRQITQRSTPFALAQQPLKLNDEQANTVHSIVNNPGVHVIFGVTGSGKTEVYMQVIQQTLEQGQQVLVLVPEIGLTPQTLTRFRKRFHCDIAIMHSQQKEADRYQAWLNAKEGQAQLIIGTRSAIFASIPKLGLIVIDEEHDQSYKQQDGMRYLAKDIALLRGQWQQCSVILGSATPSLETLHNATIKSYHVHHLRQRATGVQMPKLQIVDLRHEPCHQGLAHSTLAHMKKTLDNGQQVLVFLNRRGFAPAVICNDCGWIAVCSRCDAKLTLHRHIHQLKCHHCDYKTCIPHTCPKCQSLHINPHGQGTERIEDTLQSQLNAEVIRIDRDTMPNPKAFAQCLQRIHSREPMILLGTQMIAKGHHFPGLQLVVILDIDAGLFSSDFRAEERMAQLLSQVAGRAGRDEKVGHVIAQTYQPHHPVMQHWLAQDYETTAKYLLFQRALAHLPPVTYHVLLRAQAPSIEPIRNFLGAVQQEFMRILHTLKEQQPENQELQRVLILGPVNAQMERRAGVHRHHLLLQGPNRSSLHQLVRCCCPFLMNCKEGSRVQWGLEIDPQQF